MNNVVERVQHKADSVISYGMGGGLATSSWFIDASNYLQLGALVLGIVVVFLRILYDLEKYRQLRDKRK